MAEFTNLGQVVLVNDFEIDGKSQNVTLTTTHLFWDTAESTDQPADVNYVLLHEVVTIKPSNAKSSASEKSCWCFKKRKSVLPDANVEKQEMTALDPTAFSLYYVLRSKKTAHKWSMTDLLFYSTNTAVVQQWIAAIQSILDSNLNRPRRLLVFVNPFGGKKKSPAIFKNVVKPMLDFVSIQTTVYYTEGINYARDLLLDLPLSQYHGVVCVGGDGTVNEVFTGLILRTQRDHKLNFNDPYIPIKTPPIRVGIIPAGSTDAVSCCTIGINDAVTAVLHVIIGDSVSIDLGGIYTGGVLLRYYAAMLAYGYLGDTMEDSENYRWMGPKRYTISGFKQLCRNRSYKGEILYRTYPDPEHNPDDTEQTCKTGCTICLQTNELLRSKQNLDKGDIYGDWTSISGKFMCVNNTLISCACGKTPQGVSPSAHLGDGCVDVVTVDHVSRFNFLRYLYRLSKKSNKSVEYAPFDLEYVRVHRVREFMFKPGQKVGNLSAVDESATPGSPDAESSINESVEDGDVSNRSTAELQSMADSEMEQGDCRLPTSGCRGRKKAKRKRVKRTNSVWNCDGEIISKPELHVKIHCQAIRLFARGLEDLSNMNQNTSTDSTTSGCFAN